MNKFLSLLFIGFFSLTAIQTTTAEASTDHDKPDIKKLEQLAKKGDSEAQFTLGVMYYIGDEVKQDYKKTFKWVKKAAEAGDFRARYFLGDLYFLGQGVKQNYEEAKKWYSLAFSDGLEKIKSNNFPGTDKSKGCATAIGSKK